MASSVEVRLAERGIQLPTPARSAANYLPFTPAGNLVFVSGQLPIRDGALIATGKLGDQLDLAAGLQAAEWCAINVVAQARQAVADLDRISRLVKITVFVASAPHFTGHHLVANGASDLFITAFAERGRHSRSAIGLACLPMDAPVEVEAIFETTP